jgi:hypothetical protein
VCGRFRVAFKSGPADIVSPRQISSYSFMINAEPASPDSGTKRIGW